MKRLFRTLFLLLALVVLGEAKMSAQEAYAVYDSTEGSLTFYYDSNKASYGSSAFDLNTGTANPAWFTYRSSISTVTFDDSFADARPTSCYSWFYDMSNLTTINGLENLNTSEVTTMYQMFRGCSKLTALDLSTFDTSSALDLSSMFSGCQKLENITFGSGWNNSSATDMSSMFSACSSLTSLDLRGLNTSSVTNMNGMFYNCRKLVFLNLSGWNTASVTNTKQMFYYCDKLTTIISNDWDTSALTTYEGMFQLCYSLAGGNGTVYNPMDNFKEILCLDTDEHPGYFSSNEPYAILSEDKTTLTFYCDLLKSTRTGTPYVLNAQSSDPGWKGTSTITTVVFDESFVDARPSSTGSWFYNMKNLTSITSLENLNTSKVTNMSSMFDGCTSFTSLDLSSFKTSNVTNMSFMFNYCTNLESITFGEGWDTGKVTDMSYMFFNCKKLPSINVMNWDTSNVDNMYCMFTSCGKLTLLITRYWDTSKVTNMSYMFYGCNSIKSFEVDNWDTSKVTDMSYMFTACSSLTSLNLNSFNTAGVTMMNNMFSSCSGLTEILLGNGWDTSAATRLDRMFMGCQKLEMIFSSSDWTIGSEANTSEMFGNCVKLTGGNGTAYDENHIDGTYARVDVPGTPGYFTNKIAYAFISADDTSLTFYCDTQKGTRTEGTTYFLPTGTTTGWRNVASTLTSVTFDASFAEARPTTCYGWFLEMTNLEGFYGLENFNTSEVTNMGFMFAQGLGKITNLDLRALDTHNVTNMNAMFNACGSAHINLSGWDISNVSDMSYMFYSSSKIKTLDLRGWVVSNVTTMEALFCNCKSLTTIYADDWATQPYPGSYSYIFYGCTSLVGGRGTAYDASNIHKFKFALRDYNGHNYPGYFTPAPPDPGNLNEDERVDVSDVTGLVSVILGNDATVPHNLNHKAADVNGDGNIDVTDVTALVGIILGAH